LDQIAAESIPGAHDLVFTPFLAGGEQGALWNPRLFSAMLGLTTRHSQSDIARAYLEGVFFEIRRCVDVLAETTPIDSLRVSGNIVEARSSLQMLADILGRPVGGCRDKSPAAVGAAILARRIVPAELPIDRRAATELTHPDSAASGLYESLYRRYLTRAAKCE
jgi:xylulokinase